MTIKNLLLTAAIATLATATFGQVPRTDRQVRPNLASEKPEQRHAILMPKRLIALRDSTFGQVPKTDRQVRPNLANEKPGQRNELLLSIRSELNRAPQVSSLLLDSIVYVYNRELFPDDMNSDNTQFYEYNTAGNLIFRWHREWNPYIQEWESPWERRFDDYGHTILYSLKYWVVNWDETTQQLVFEELRGGRDEWAYDSLSWRIFHSNDQFRNGQWVGNEYVDRTVKTYTDNADSYIETTTLYRCKNNVWSMYRKTERTFKGQRQMRDINGYPYPDAVNINDSFVVLPDISSSSPTYGDYDPNLLTEASWNYNAGAVSDGIKKEFTKNAGGNTTQIKHFTWNTATNAWSEEESYKTEIEYNEQGLITGYFEYDRDSQNGGWQTLPFSYTVAYTFDSNSNVLSFEKRIVSDCEWTDQKEEYTYDAQNRILSKVHYTSDNDGGWLKEIMYECAYDSYGHPNLLIAKGGWENGDWSWQEKQEQMFDAYDRGIMYSDIYSDPYFVNGYKYEYEYAFDGDREEVSCLIRYNYDFDTHEFVLDEKTERTFSDVPVVNSEFKYNLLSLNEYVYDRINNEWVLTLGGRFNWTFDAASNPLFLSVDVENLIDYHWEQYYTATFHYSQHEISGLPTAVNNQLRVWISGDNLQIEGAPIGEAVQIFDITGRKVISQATATRPVNISTLSRGVYILKLGNITKKFLKE